jgi:hypothetical protein
MSLKCATRGAGGVERGTNKANLAVRSIVRNKPNFRGRDTPSFHFSIIPAFQSGADRAKQSQFPPGRQDHPAAVAGGPACETNPIGSSPAGTRGANYAKQTQLGGVSSLKFQGLSEEGQGTKPCPTSEVGDCFAPLAMTCFRLQTCHGPAVETNKPNIGKPGRNPGAGCAKQSQSAAREPPAEIPYYSSIPSFQYSSPKPVASNKANLSAGPIVRNKANSPRTARRANTF